jgi:hypothetical protein
MESDVKVQPTKIKKFVSNEWVRFIPFILIAGLLLVPQAQSQAVLFNAAIVTALLVLSHIFRRVLFPYVQLEECVQQAQSQALPAAIIFASMCYLISVFIQSTVVLLK